MWLKTIVLNLCKCQTITCVFVILYAKKLICDINQKPIINKKNWSNLLIEQGLWDTPYSSYC